MKPEDLKVGMVFEDIKYKVYSKIFHVTQNRVFYYIFNKILGCGSIDKDIFLLNYDLIDKVPPKIVEVEEETSMYGFKNEIKQLILGLSGYLFLVHGISKYPEKIKMVELCKIKRTVKKELNFNWDKGEYEDELPFNDRKYKRSNEDDRTKIQSSC